MARMPRDANALLAEARAAAAPPLKFGDIKQIEAVKLLAQAQEQYEHLKSCPRCQNWEACDHSMSVDFDVEDAAWAMFVSDREASND